MSWNEIEITPISPSPQEVQTMELLADHRRRMVNLLGLAFGADAHLLHVVKYLERSRKEPENVRKTRKLWG